MCLEIMILVRTSTDFEIDLIFNALSLEGSSMAKFPKDITTSMATIVKMVYVTETDSFIHFCAVGIP